MPIRHAKGNRLGGGEKSPWIVLGVIEKVITVRQ